MLWNFFTIIFRSLIYHRLCTYVNVFGLAVCMAGVLMISMYILGELSYDAYHERANRIFRITVTSKIQGREQNMSVTAPPVAHVLKKTSLFVEDATRLARFGAWVVSKDNKQYNENNFLFADPNFFRVFSFNFISGNPDSVLAKPRSIVLTRTAARKYFGNGDPLGQTIRLETGNVDYTVTGYIEDVPDNSHFYFSMLGSLSTFDSYLKANWTSPIVYTYVTVNETTDNESLEEELERLSEKYFTPQICDYLHDSDRVINPSNHSVQYKLQPLRRIHLYSDLEHELEPNNRPVSVYVFCSIAFIILLMACLNFMSLLAANSARRTQEVAIRKIMGLERKFLIFQFLLETVLLCFLALFLALLLSEIAMPYFSRLLNVELKFHVLSSFKTVSVIFLTTFLLGMIAGSYPAILMSSFHPVFVLNNPSFICAKNLNLRFLFVGFQIFLSILIITMSIVVFSQIDFMLCKLSGCNKERMVVIGRPDASDQKIENFKQEILRHPNVESASHTNLIPGRDFRLSAFAIEKKSKRENVLMNHIFVGHDFHETYDLRMRKGRFFSQSLVSDSSACVINESAAHEMKLENIENGYIEMSDHNFRTTKRLKVIGIVKDFHFGTFEKKIAPLVISLIPGNWEGYLNVRLSPEYVDHSIQYLRGVWEKYISEYPLEYFFLDCDFNRNYQTVIRTGKILILFSILSLFISCLGLYGLVFSVNIIKAKEIGIRKAAGASSYSILKWLYKETILLVFIATICAWVAGFVFSNIWLQS